MGVGIQVDKLNAWFGKTQALQDINMTVAANHATAVIGPSGCGKSTFVRCLNRMHETIPEARATGRVRIGEMDVYNGTSAGADSPPHRHGVSEGQSVSHDVDLRQRGRRAEAERFPRPQATGRDRRAVAAPSPHCGMRSRTL